MWWLFPGRKELANSKDGEGMTTDLLLPSILKSAEKYGTKIAFHFEPYEGRTAASTREDIKYVIDNYGSSPSFYRDSASKLPIIYMYDSYKTPANEWATIFGPQSKDTIRGTKYDAIVIALYLSGKDRSFITSGHFDGLYTYFAADGFTEGSTSNYWKGISDWALSAHKIISISVGPGYDDSRIRPWNYQNIRSREKGQYYDSHWATAINAKPHIISITSYNEWMEGTQIEPVTPKNISKTIFNNQPFKYKDYEPLSPDYYIKRTFYWSQKFCE